jgi:hypothetical protein
MKSAAAEERLAEKLRKSQRTFRMNFCLLKSDTLMRMFSAENSAAPKVDFRYTFESLGAVQEVFRTHLLPPSLN